VARPGRVRSGLDAAQNRGDSNYYRNPNGPCTHNSRPSDLKLIARGAVYRPWIEVADCRAVSSRRCGNDCATTDHDGQFAWRSAPKDAVLYGIGRADFMRADVSLAPSEREHLVAVT
jgi:hypothetical protein